MAAGGGGSSRGRRYKVPAGTPPQPTYALEDLTMDTLRTIHAPADVKTSAKGGAFAYLSYHPDSRKPMLLKITERELPFPIRMQQSDDAKVGSQQRWAFDARTCRWPRDATPEDTAAFESKLKLLDDWCAETLEAKWGDWFPMQKELGEPMPTRKTVIKRKYQMERNADGTPSNRPARDDDGKMIPYKPTFGLKAAWGTVGSKQPFVYAGVYDATDGHLCAEPAFLQVLDERGQPVEGAVGKELLPETLDWRETRFVVQVPNPDAPADAPEAERFLNFDTLPVLDDKGEHVRCARTGRAMARYISPEDLNYGSRLVSVIAEVNSLWFVDGKCGLTLMAKQVIFEQNEERGAGGGEEDAVLMDTADAVPLVVSRAAPTADLMNAAKVAAGRKRAREAPAEDLEEKPSATAADDPFAADFAAAEDEPAAAGPKGRRKKARA